MRRGWFLLLALSVGLNAGLLYVTLSDREHPVAHQGPPGKPPAGEAEHGRRGPPPSQDDLIQGRLNHLSHALNLEPSQREHMEAYLLQVLPQVFVQRETVMALQKALPSRVADPETATEQLRAVVQELNIQQARLDSLVAETMLGELSLLTPAQRQNYARVMPRAKPVEPPLRP